MKLSLGGMIGTAVTVVTLVGGIIAIKQYYDQTPSHDLTGTWTVTDRIEQTSYSPFKNLELTYTVTITQNGPDFTGSGTKTMESGHPLIGKAHTPIEIKGKLNRDSILASFTEQGVERRTTGEFRWKLANDGSWVGTFFSDAANSKGTSLLSQANVPPQ